MKLAFTAFLVLVALGACGTDDSDDESGGASGNQAASDVKSGGPGTYIATTAGGGTVRVDLTGERGEYDALVNDTQAVAKKAGDDGAELVPVSIDNTNGEEAVDLMSLSIVTADGRTLDGALPMDALTEWQDSLSDDDYNLGVSAYNGWLERQSVLPGAKDSTVFVFDEQPADIKSVFIDGEQASLE